jgi:hypothetical protein
MVADHPNICSIPQSAQEVKTLEQTPFTFVDSKDLLDVLAKKLQACSEVAIDVEHHNVRSF